MLNSIDRESGLHRRKRAVLEELLAAVLYKLMMGEVRVGEVRNSGNEQNRLPVLG